MVFGIIASIGSAIVSAVSSIGPAVSSFCATVLPRIVPVLEQVGPALKGIANVVLTILNIFKPGEDVENMGDRALQASEQDIKPEKFDTFDEYMAEIRAFPLDPDKSTRLSSAEKLAAGLAIGATGMEKKFDALEGTLGPIWLLAASNPAYFTAERLINIVQSGSHVVDILRYFEGKLGPADAVNARDVLVGMEGQRSPEKSKETIYAEINIAKDAVKNLDSQS
jgi:hypothetical protein